MFDTNTTAHGEIDWTETTADLGQLFKLPEAYGANIRVLKNNDKFVQRTSANYAFNKDMVKALLAFVMADNDGDAFLFYGPYGCGKTSCIREVLGRLRRPVLMMSWNETADSSDLIGRMGISFGNTQFEYGPLTLAAKYGYILVVNEIDRGRAGNLVALNDILDGGKLLIKETGEVITPHQNFRVICTANSAGSGDFTGSYTGSVRKLDPAFLDRFAMMRVDYMSPESEANLLMLTNPDFAGASSRFIMQMATFASETRQKYEDVADPLNTPCSTRALQRFFRFSRSLGMLRELANGGRPSGATLIMALDLAYTNRLGPEEREVINTMIGLHFPN